MVRRSAGFILVLGVGKNYEFCVWSMMRLVVMIANPGGFILFFLPSLSSRWMLADPRRCNALQSTFKPPDHGLAVYSEVP